MIEEKIKKELKAAIEKAWYTSEAQTFGEAISAAVDETFKVVLKTHEAKEYRELFNDIHRATADVVDCEVFISELNLLLNNLCGDDYFGTEGQLDPRGDHRDYHNGPQWGGA